MAAISTVSAAPGTDIWRQPPSHDVFTAPRLSPPSPVVATGPATALQSARVSFSFPWTEQFDQAGILLSFDKKGDNRTATGQSAAKWIKAGVEYFDGSPRLSVVATDTWSDWSVVPLPNTANSTAPPDPSAWTTIAVERVTDSIGLSLWVYHVLDDGSKVPLRQVCWVYGLDDSDQWQLAVAAIAARPAENTTSHLTAQIRDFQVLWDGSS